LDEKKVCDISQDIRFARVKTALSKARIRSRDEGNKGGEEKARDPLRKEHFEALWAEKILSVDEPQGLWNAMILMTTVIFGFRGRQENLSLKWKCFKEMPEVPGTEQKRTLIFLDRFTTKTRRDASPVERYYVKSCNPDQIDYFRIWDEYRDHLTSAQKHAEAMVYWTPKKLHNRTMLFGDRHWYGPDPSSANSIQCFLKNMIKQSESACFQDGRNYSNHSARKTCGSALFSAGFNEIAVKESTGHSSTSAMMSYISRDMERESQKSSTLTQLLVPTIAPQPLEPEPFEYDWNILPPLDFSVFLPIFGTIDHLWPPATPILEEPATSTTVSEPTSADYEIIDSQEVQEPLSQEESMFLTQYIAEEDEITDNLLAFLKDDDPNATISIDEAIKWD
jgi:hypothetical protein